jgi:hypothetical protein
MGSWSIGGESPSHPALEFAPFLGAGKTARSIDEEVEMPVHRGKDSKGPYYQWGDSGKKYHYQAGEKKSRDSAKQKATKQGQAARASGYKG